MEGLQVIKESSWIVSQGSLDSSVVVFAEDPSAQDENQAIIAPSLEHEQLILVPSEVSEPCQITVKFLQRLYHVHGIYILSTARTCELYSQVDLHEDPEYVCTVRGWVPEQADGSGGKSEDTVSDNLSIGLRLSSAHEGPVDIVAVTDNSKENGSSRDGLGACLSCKEQFNCNQMTDTDSATNPYVTLSTGDCEATGSRDDCQDKSTFSSSDDSWVELCGSFGGNLRGQEVMEYLQNQSDGKQEDVQLGTGAYEVLYKSDGNSHRDDEAGVMVYKTDGVLHKDNKAVVMSEHKSRKKWQVDELSPASSEENKHAEADSAEAKLSVVGKKYITPLILYEADFELVDSEACAAVTIRLLSLQDRSCVIVSQILFLVSPGPVASISNTVQSTTAGGNSALLAMLMPSMLQMVRGLKSDQTFPGQYVANLGKRLNKLENVDGFSEANSNNSPTRGEASKAGSSNEKATWLEPSLPQIMCTSRSAGSLEEGLNKLENVDGLSKVISNISLIGGGTFKAESSSQRGTRLETFLPQVLHPTVSVREANTEPVGSQGWTSHASTKMMIGQRSKGGLFESKETERLVEAQTPVEVCGEERECSQESEAIIAGKPSLQGLQDEVILEKFAERFDRLEQLCSRMECYLHKAIENLDRRLRILEAQHMREGHIGQKQVSNVDLDLLNINNAAREFLSTEEKLPSHFEEAPASNVMEGHACQDLEHVAVIRNPLMSLDDAWASAFCAFSAGCVHSTAKPSGDWDMPLSRESLSSVKTLEIITESTEPASCARDALSPQHEDGEEHWHGGSVCCEQIPGLSSSTSQTWKQNESYLHNEDNLFSHTSGESSVLVSNECLSSDMHNINQDCVELVPQENFTCLVMEEMNQLKYKKDDSLDNKEVTNDCFKESFSEMNSFSLGQNVCNQSSLSSDPGMEIILEESNQFKSEAMVRKDLVEEHFAIANTPGSGQDGLDKKGLSEVEIATVLEKLNQFDHKKRDITGCKEATYNCLEDDCIKVNSFSCEHDVSVQQGISDIETDACLSDDNDATVSQEGSLYISQEFDIRSEGYSALEQDIEQDEVSMQNMSGVLDEETRELEVDDLFWLNVKSYIPSQNLGVGGHQDLPQFPSVELRSMDFLSMETTRSENLLCQQTVSCKHQQEMLSTVFPGFEGL